MSDRYAIGGEGEFQPGSEGRVLSNLLDITDPQDMDEAETALLHRLYQTVMEENFPDRRITVTDLKRWHRQWLGNVYEWAGFTPCRLDEAAAVAAIAETHVEFILIHPFREGNGRLSRLLADVMAMQAGHEPLDYSDWDEDRAAYIAAIHAGFAGDYAPMRSRVAQAWRDARER